MSIPNTSEELRYHDCRNDSDVDWSEMQYDAQGIPLTRTCEKCHEVKMSKYRPEILTGYTQEDVNEPIEAEWGSDW